MKVEDVAGIGFASGGAAQEEGHLAIGPGVLAQVIIDDESVLAVVHEFLAHSAAREGSEVLEGGRIGSRCGDHDSVFHGAVAFEDTDG